MGEQKVLIADKIADVGVDILANNFDVVVQTGMTEDELCAIIGDFSAIVVRSATKVTQRVLDAASQLKVIARAGAGLDNVDVVAAKARGIEVVNAPDANTRAVAEHTMGLMLALARHLPEADYSLKHGQWKKSALLGTGLYGKTLGIIGFGKIGREVANRALAFGMRVLVNQRRRTPELDLEGDVSAVDLFDLLKQSDIVTIHVPLKPETVGMIGATELAVIKRGAYLINTARGSIVDEQALLEALDSGRLAGAALDVFAEEPAVDSAIVQHPKVISTPHIAASTSDAQQAAAITIADKITAILTAVSVENPLALHILPLDNVFPHEEIDPRRVSQLVSRLKTEKILKNPPIVAEWEGKFVVLDGATRVTALKKMGFAHLVAQVVSLKDAQVEAQTWNHVIQEMTADEFLAFTEECTEVTHVEVDPNYIEDSMMELGGICYVVTPDFRTCVVRAAPDGSRLDALNGYVAKYIEAASVARTRTANFHEAMIEYPKMNALIVFPKFTVEQILQISSIGKTVPAGITRMVVSGRVLRLNLNLERLQSDEPLAIKSAWLNDTVHALIENHHVRYYEEPVYLLDE